MLKVTILDTKTGNKKSVDVPNSFELAENNWSCDCNRDVWNVTEKSNVCKGLLGS